MWIHYKKRSWSWSSNDLKVIKKQKNLLYYQKYYVKLYSYNIWPMNAVSSSSVMSLRVSEEDGYFNEEGIIEL